MGLNLDHPYVETGDRLGALQDWRVEGITSENTDRGRLYVRQSGGQLQLFKDKAGAQLVAQGADANGADVVLSEQNGSGLSAVVYRNEQSVAENVTLYVQLCSELDLREQVDNLEGLLLANEVDFNVPLRKTMRAFLVEFSARYPPPPGVGAPLRYSPSTVEAGKDGDQEYTAQFFYSLNNRGAWEITGLQNPDDYREWAIQRTLSMIFERKVRSATEGDPWFSRYMLAKDNAKREWKLIKPWVDVDSDGLPDRQPKIRSIRLRRG